MDIHIGVVIVDAKLMCFVTTSTFCVLELLAFSQALLWVFASGSI
jgi:hypothetical protein